MKQPACLVAGEGCHLRACTVGSMSPSPAAKHLASGTKSHVRLIKRDMEHRSSRPVKKQGSSATGGEPERALHTNLRARGKIFRPEQNFRRNQQRLALFLGKSPALPINFLRRTSQGIRAKCWQWQVAALRAGVLAV